MAHYVYDHSGERVLKTIITGSILNTNSQGQSVLRMESPTVYVNPYYIASHYLETELASKHYYMGSQRIASALVSLPFNAGSQTDPGMGGEGEEGEGPVFGEGNLSTSEDAVIQDLSATFNCLFGRTIELDYDGMLKLISIGEPILFDDCEGGVSTEASEIDPTCACEQSTYWAQIGGVACNTMPIMYWYHPDYLGSVEFVTDMNGNPYQLARTAKLGGFFHNTIWGENLQNHMAFSFKSFSSRFRFNGKEWDEETGNFYYGARYYDPETSVWLSVDRLSDKYPGMSPYNFTMNNPLNLIDPNGDSVNVAVFIHKYNTEWSQTKSDLEQIGGLTIGVSKKGNITAQINPDAEGYSQDARDQLLHMIGSDKKEHDVMILPQKTGESQGGGNLVKFSIGQVNTFIKGTSSDLNPMTLGFGMSFLHELGHTNVGGSLMDLKTGGENGKNVDRMNDIRAQLGDDYGYRYYEYHSPGMSSSSFIPFSKQSYDDLRDGFVPPRSFIEIPRKSKRMGY